MELSKIAKRAVSTRPGATALEASEQMVLEKIGAMVVLDTGKLVGIISERDIVGRLVARRLDPEKTLVSEIMTTRVQTITDGTSDVKALELMHHGRFRHLPLVDGAGQVIGMLSMRHLMRERIGELALKNADLMAFISTDGAGGD
jgi:CBS domain-containing protein